MSIFSLADFSLVHRAVTAVSAIHGSYRAVELLGKALADVEVSADFDENLKRWTSQQGSTYEGPSDTTRNIVKGLRTAANTDNKDDRNALLELLALVLSKLTVAQGTRVVAIMLTAAGMNPQLLTLAIKVCVLAARTRAGRRIVESVEPKIEEAISVLADKSELIEPVKELAASIGDKGKQLLSSLSAAAQTPIQAAKKIADSGISFLDQLKPADDS